MKKTWIKIKRGLNEPKHREAMGMAIWLYMHILDRVDWETGTVYDWRDADEADDMGMNHRTVRSWRRKLEDEGYISTVQKQYNLEISVLNWTNPRNYDGKVLNKKEQRDTKNAPSGVQGDTQGDTQGDSESVTPTYNSHITEHISANAETSLSDEDFWQKKNEEKKAMETEEHKPLEIKGLQSAILSERKFTKEDQAVTRGDTVDSRLSGWYELVPDTVIHVIKTFSDAYGKLPPAAPKKKKDKANH
ncbi:MAG: hypothetical protein GY755_19955, partial [Chloroflexi bacterium]|nr:hypothetical protein [Chloroflexota bacterium]